MKGEGDNKELVLNDTSPVYVTEVGDIDEWLLKDSLAKTPWERMQANDDALNFGDSLRAAMKERHAKLK